MKCGLAFSFFIEKLGLFPKHSLRPCALLPIAVGLSITPPPSTYLCCSKTFPFPLFTFFTVIPNSRIEEGNFFFSDVYPVSWDVRKFPSTFLSVVTGRLPECSTSGSPSNVTPVMWEMAQTQVIQVHEKDLQKNSPPSEELWEFTGSLWRWTPFGHGIYALGIQIFLSF